MKEFDYTHTHKFFFKKEVARNMETYSAIKDQIVIIFLSRYFFSLYPILIDIIFAKLNIANASYKNMIKEREKLNLF